MWASGIQQKILFNYMILISFLTVFVFSLSGSVQAQMIKGERDEAFLIWLDGVEKEALEKGISQKTLDLVLPTISPLEKIVKQDRSQPEVKQTYARYLKLRVSDWRKSKGPELLKKHEEIFTEVEEHYGVQRRFIAAIWGAETNYGTFPLTISVFDAVATLAYDKRRAKRFRRELFAALKILDQGHLTLEDMKSSWAGAMGQVQFMPENYLKFAKDHNKDGYADIWESYEDVFASVAVYLNAYGWRNDITWGRKVKLPKGGEEGLPAAQAEGLTPAKHCKAYKSMGAWRKLSEWQKLGIRREGGEDLPTRDLKAALIIGDKGDDMGYLVYSNFCSIMRYNPSFKYALAIGLLSDAIAK